MANTLYNTVVRILVGAMLLGIFSMAAGCSHNEYKHMEDTLDSTLSEGNPFTTTLGLYSSRLLLNELRSGGVENISEVQNLRVLVFDEDQKFLYTAVSVLGGNPVASPSEDEKYLPDQKREGITQMRPFEVQLIKSSKPRYLHFVADYDWKNFSQDYFLKGTAAGELVTRLQTTLTSANGNNPTDAFSPMWSVIRVEKLDENTLKDRVIKLLRNYAKVSIEVAESVRTTDDFVLQSYCIANSMDKGTVAPFKVDNYSYSFPFTVTQPTVPADANFLPAVEANMIDPSKTFNLFEHKNKHETKKICVIIKGLKKDQTRFYKIDFVNRSSSFSVNEYLPILRNNWYVVKVSSVKADGYSTFEEALQAPADNNIFASVEMKSYTKVSDGKYELTADPIEIVIVKPGNYSFDVIFNGTQKYTRFYPNWDKASDSYMGDYSFDSTKPTQLQTRFDFKAKSIPSDNILEYKVDVVGLRYANKTSGLNPGDPGYDPNAKEPVIDGITGATTPITRTVHITLRKPYQFNAKLDKDYTSSDPSDMILSFQIYKTIPEALLPLEVLIQAKDISPRNKGLNTDLMIVEREHKLYYRYMIRPEVFKEKIESNNPRIEIPVTINDGTTKVVGDITLSSELYLDETIHGEATKVLENTFAISYKIPDGTVKTMPATASNDVTFRLDGVSYSGDKIKLTAADDRGNFTLEILDDSLKDKQLEMSVWVRRENIYGSFNLLVKGSKTVSEWLTYKGDLQRPDAFKGAAIKVKGFLVHRSSSGYYDTYMPSGYTPSLWAIRSGNYRDTDITSYYHIDSSAKYRDGRYGYDISFEIGENQYSNVDNGTWIGVGVGYSYYGSSSYTLYPYSWGQLINSTLMVWYYS